MDDERLEIITGALRMMSEEIKELRQEVIDMRHVVRTMASTVRNLSWPKDKAILVLEDAIQELREVEE